MRFVVRRLGFFLVTLWAAVTLNFLIPRLMPGNAAISMMSRYKGHVNPQAMHALEIAFGINNHQSLVSSYFTYLGNIARGHFGISLTFFPDTVAHQVLQALPWTLVLVGTTTIIAFALGTLIGLVSGWRRGSALDGALPPLFVITSAFPYFWLALLAIAAFTGVDSFLPSSLGYDTGLVPGWNAEFVDSALKHSILPAGTIVVTSVAGWLMGMRNMVVTVSSEDYVTVAHAKGLTERRVMFGYAARNALLPSVSGFGMALGLVVGGTFLVEYVFSYPGVGLELVGAIGQKDYPVMQGIFLVITLSVLAANFLADLVYMALDPRTRTEG